MVGIDFLFAIGVQQCLGALEGTREAKEEDYDPRKPEYIAPATPEEVERHNAHLLAKQIARLEASAMTHSKAAQLAHDKVAQHYQHVAETLKSKQVVLGGHARNYSHVRIRSEPNMPLPQGLQGQQLRQSWSVGRERRRANTDCWATPLEESQEALDELESPLEEMMPPVNSVRRSEVHSSPFIRRSEKLGEELTEQRRPPTAACRMTGDSDTLWGPL